MKKTSPIVALFLVFTMAASFWSVPRPAHALFGAGDIVSDLITEIETGATHIATAAQLALGQSLNVKEFALDPIAWAVAKMAIQSMTKSLVNWINSGFNGSPAFVTDLEGHLQNVGDAVAGPFIGQLGSNASLRSPFQSVVAQAVGSRYYLSTSQDGFFTEAAYTLNQYTPNDVAFTNGDFSQGGISAWFAAFSNPANNRYGAEMLADQELARRVSRAQQTAVIQLNWGQGFLSWCGDSTSGDANTSGGTGTVNITPQVNPATVCIKDGKPGSIQTPGSVLASLTNKTLGLSADQLVTADEFNEIIGALMSQLTNQVVGGLGLSGVSSVSSGGRGFIDQAADPSQYAGATGGNSPNAALSQTITGQVQTVQAYQTDWKTITDEAQLAVNASSNCSIASDVLNQGKAADAKAVAALALLQKIQADANAGGSDQAKLAAAGAEFQQALASSAMPSAGDAAYAHVQAQNLPNGATLFSHMENIATTGECS